MAKDAPENQEGIKKMTARLTTMALTYEVKVKCLGQLMMLHYEARNHHKAVEAAQNDGYRVVSVRKLDIEKLMGDIEKLDLNTETLEGKHHPALAAEDRVFNRRKRLIRRYKEKEYRDVVDK